MSQNFLKVLPGAREGILKWYKYTEQSLKDDVNTLKNWFKDQPHLPETPTDAFIEKFLLLNKGSIENTKQRIDMYYTVRSLVPENYEKINPEVPEMQKMLDNIYNFPLPIQTDDFYRVTVVKIENPDVDVYDPHLVLGAMINVAEVMCLEDFSIGIVIIYDFQNVKLGHLTKASPMFIKKALVSCEKVFKLKVKNVHVINVPSFSDAFMTILRAVLKPKLLNRVVLHKDHTTLSKYVSNEILPADYGGQEKSLKEINGLYKKTLQCYQARFDKLDKMRVNESLRPEKTFNDDILGYHGNFKQLNLD